MSEPDDSKYDKSKRQDLTPYLPRLDPLHTTGVGVDIVNSDLIMKFYGHSSIVMLLAEVRWVLFQIGSHFQIRFQNVINDPAPSKFQDVFIKRLF